MDYLQYGKFLLNENQMTQVLNLIINGLPSILLKGFLFIVILILVLNLIINGLPSIQCIMLPWLQNLRQVLNLIINGLPSIPSIV